MKKPKNYKNRKVNESAILGNYKKVTKCRACNNSKLHRIYSFGLMPKPNGFLKKQQLSKSEEFFPLSISFCGRCGMVQLDQIVKPSKMFENYVYLSSASKPMVEHLAQFAANVYKKYKLTSSSLVIDIGSNDGTLLRHFKKLGTKVLGVDPAKNIAREANKSGIPTVADFFSLALSKKIIKKHAKADVVSAVNVIAHIDNWSSLFKGVYNLLDDNGIFIAEFPYLVNMIKDTEFDTIYHEHLSYVSATPLEIALNKHGLEIIDIERYPEHGGSLRVYAQKRGSRLVKTSTVNHFLNVEKNLHLNKKVFYSGFVKSINKINKDINGLLAKILKQGKSIIGYGASAKGNIFLNYTGITKEKLPLIVDSTKYKQGLFTPGVHIPIFPEEDIKRFKHDYVLVLAWNFADEILKKNKNLIKSGTKFIVAIPKLHIYK